MSEPPLEMWLGDDALGTLERAPRVAVSASGRVVAVWQSLAPDGSWDIGYRFSPDFGVTWSPAQLMYRLKSQNVEPQVAMDDAGNALLLLAAPSDATSWIAVYSAVAPVGADVFAIVEEIEFAGINQTLSLHRYGTSAMAFFNDVETSARDLHAVELAFDGTVIEHRIIGGPLADHPASLCEDRATGDAYIVRTQEQSDAIEVLSLPFISAEYDLSIDTASSAHQNRPFCHARDGQLWIGYTEEALGDDDATAPAIRLAHFANRSGAGFSDVALDDPGYNSLVHPTLAGDGDAFRLLYYAGNGPGDPNGAVRLMTSDGASVGDVETISSVRFDAVELAEPDIAVGGGYTFAVHVFNGNGNPRAKLYRR